MQLETEGRRGAFSVVTDEQLRQVFADDFDHRRGCYVRLNQAPEIYMQASGENAGPYQLEYREGDAAHHFTAGVECAKADVQRAFQSYLAGDDQWRTMYAWEKLEMKSKPWWKVW